MIEQAIFSSALTDRSRGYQLVAVSPGIGQDDARELTAWGPSHGSLCEADAGGSSVNFHPLPSGRWCVGETVAGGEEYSGRGGVQVYTRLVVLSPDDLARFANNPFAVLRALRNCGMLEVENRPPKWLAAFELPGRAAAVDEGLLAEFADRWGAKRIAWLIETALGSDTLLVVGADNRDALLAGLLNCLPVECRPELSFATGLAHSLRRPFRINALAIDRVELRRLKRQPGITLLDLTEEPPADYYPTGWAAYVLEAMEMDRLAHFCAELERPRPGLRLSDLSWLVEQLKQRLLCDPIAAEGPRDDERRSRSTDGDESFSDSSRRDNGFGSTRQISSGRDCLAHTAHARFESQFMLNIAQTVVEESGRVAKPSAALPATSSAALEQLERLDDLVFDTINGRRPALEELAVVWPQLSAELPAELLAESQEQYLRYAIKVWESSVGEGLRNPDCAVAALDVLCILFGNES